jgi:hypothetical protein
VCKDGTYLLKREEGKGEEKRGTTRQHEERAQKQPREAEPRIPTAVNKQPIKY